MGNVKTKYDVSDVVYGYFMDSSNYPLKIFKGEILRIVVSENSEISYEFVYGKGKFNPGFISECNIIGPNKEDAIRDIENYYNEERAKLTKKEKSQLHSLDII